MKWSRREAIIGLAALAAGVVVDAAPADEVEALGAAPPVTSFEGKDRAEWDAFRKQLLEYTAAMQSTADRDERRRIYLQRYKASVLFGLTTAALRIPEWDRELGIEWAHGICAAPLPAGPTLGPEFLDGEIQRELRRT